MQQFHSQMKKKMKKKAWYDSCLVEFCFWKWGKHVPMQLKKNTKHGHTFKAEKMSNVKITPDHIWNYSRINRVISIILSFKPPPDQIQNMLDPVPLKWQQFTAFHCKEPLQNKPAQKNIYRPGYYLQWIPWKVMSLVVIIQLSTSNTVAQNFLCIYRLFRIKVPVNNPRIIAVAFLSPLSLYISRWFMPRATQF